MRVFNCIWLQVVGCPWSFDCPAPLLPPFQPPGLLVMALVLGLAMPSYCLVFQSIKLAAGMVLTMYIV